MLFSVDCRQISLFMDPLYLVNKDQKGLPNPLKTAYRQTVIDPCKTFLNLLKCINHVIELLCTIECKLNVHEKDRYTLL